MAIRKSQVVIVGAGPAGLLLAHILKQAGLEPLVLERRSREYVLGRIRAGVLEDGTAQLLRELGIAGGMERAGYVHDGVMLASQGRGLRIDFADAVQRPVIIYGQTSIQADLYEAADERGLEIIHEIEDLELGPLDGSAVELRFRQGGQLQSVTADFVAGCDGNRGVCRGLVPASALRVHERVYPFGWLGILSRTPPVDDELIYAEHERGFALCSMRNRELSRYYLQAPLDTQLEAWSDERFWDELRLRIPQEAAARLVTGLSIEKSLTPLRSLVVEPMRYKRLFLAGDAAHVVPPTGAKGLNLASSDVRLLGQAFVRYYQAGSTDELDQYSTAALARVWRAVRFSWWMTTLLHRFPDESSFDARMREAEFAQLFQSKAARAVLAENYVGLF